MSRSSPKVISFPGPRAETESFVPIPTSAIDDLMKLGPLPFMVSMVVVRKTWGWQKEEDWIAGNQFRQLLGNVNGTTFQQAVNQAVSHGFVSFRRTCWKCDSELPADHVCPKCKKKVHHTYHKLLYRPGPRLASLLQSGRTQVLNAVGMDVAPWSDTTNQQVPLVKYDQPEGSLVTGDQPSLVKYDQPTADLPRGWSYMTIQHESCSESQHDSRRESTSYFPAADSAAGLAGSVALDSDPTVPVQSDHAHEREDGLPMMVATTPTVNNSSIQVQPPTTEHKPEEKFAKLNSRPLLERVRSALLAAETSSPDKRTVEIEKLRVAAGVARLVFGTDALPMWQEPGDKQFKLWKQAVTANGGYLLFVRKCLSAAYLDPVNEPNILGALVALGRKQQNDQPRNPNEVKRVDASALSNRGKVYDVD